jgi:hypothetical protein
VWDNAYKPSWLFFELTQWVAVYEMSEEEKQQYPEHKTTRGYLKTLGYKEAFLQSFQKAGREDQAAVRNLPCFDEEIFFDISGIKLSEYGV